MQSLNNAALFFRAGFFRLEGSGFFRLACQGFFACFSSGKFRLEAVDTAFGVDDLFFTGKERVRSGRNVDFYEWVLVAIFPFNSVGRLRG